MSSSNPNRPGMSRPTSASWSMFGSGNGTPPQSSSEVDDLGLIEGHTTRGVKPARTPDFGPPGGSGVSFPLDQIYDPEAPEGVIGRVIADIIRGSGGIKRKLPNAKDDYLNNFIINLHNHNIPFPIPLQYYITDIGMSNTNVAPYASCDFQLKMPLSTALGIFTGPNAHPEPGQWLVIRNLENDDDAPYHATDVFRPFSADEWQAGSPDKFGESLTDLVFFGTVTSLNWDITVDSRTGLQMASITVKCNSFLHNLIYGEYGVKNAALKDQVESEIDMLRFEDGISQGGIELLERDASQSASERYFFKWSDWYRFMKGEASAAVGKVNLNQSLRYMVSVLGYPELPVSLRFEPTDFASWFVDFASTTEGIVERMKRLYTAFGPEVGGALINGVISVMEILQVENSLIDSSGVRSAAAAKYFEIFEANADQEGGTGYFELRPGEHDSVDEVNELRAFLGDPDSYHDAKLTLGGLIHIATTRDDIPPSHPLWGTMPHSDEPFIDLNRIKTYGMKNTTVWDLIKGTFQPDSQLIELYPCILSASARDIKDYYAHIKDFQMHPMYKFLGGIPTIILRMKPVHPIIGRKGINSTVVNSEKRFNRDRGASHFSYIPDLEYVPASETVQDPVTGRNLADFKDNSYGQPLPYFVNPRQSLTHPDYSYATALPVSIYPYEIFSLSFGQSDLARINSVKVNSPELANLTTRARYSVEGDMVHNVEMALRHGWRSYNPTWPYREYRGDPSTREGTETTVTSGRIMSALAERMYMIAGDDQMYFRGTISCKSQIRKSITPGVWIEIPMEMSNKPRAKYSRQQNFLAYVTSIAHDYDIDQDTGEITMTSIIGFERGSYGGIVGNLPSYKGPTLDVQAYLKDLGVDTDQAISASQAQRATRTQLPSWAPPVIENTATAHAIRAYVALRIGKGDLTPEEGQAIIASGEVPSDDYTLYQTLIQRFGGGDGHDTDGTPQ